MMEMGNDKGTPKSDEAAGEKPSGASGARKETASKKAAPKKVAQKKAVPTKLSGTPPTPSTSPSPPSLPSPPTQSTGKEPAQERQKTTAKSGAKTTAKSGAKSATSKTKAAPKKNPKKAKQWQRRRGGEAKAISDLMPQIGRGAFRKFGFVQSSIVTRWPEIVGKQHARFCQPEALRFRFGEKENGTLQLVVVPAHAPLIQHVIPEITERVNRFFGYSAVAHVKIRQGQVKAPPAQTEAGAPPSLRPIPLELGDSLRDVGDGELRKVLESLARSMAEQEERENEHPIK